jgi:protein-tyrosine phosphatase
MSGSLPMIDLHSHILPGADHGSSGISEAKAQLELIQNAGIHTIVATPHFYPNENSVEGFLDLVNSAAANLTEIVCASPRIALGAEVLFCDNIHHMENLDQLCIRGTSVLLLELPMSTWGSNLFRTVKELAKEFTVVLAHIDRYVSKQKKELLHLMDLGALAQVNAYAFASLRTRHKLAPFLRSGSVVALGSDLHGTDESAHNAFSSAKKYLGEEFDAIMARSTALLHGAEYLN